MFIFISSIDFYEEVTAETKRREGERERENDFSLSIFMVIVKLPSAKRPHNDVRFSFSFDITDSHKDKRYAFRTEFISCSSSISMP